MKYKFELNLSRMAMISKAVSLWQQPDIKNETREFFREDMGNEGLDRGTSNEEKWHNITKSVLKQLESQISPMVLPPILNAELIHVVRSIGEKIYNWYEYLCKHIGPNDKQPVTNYIEKIYWTYYGTIDEVKILKSFWLDNPRVDVAKVYNLACEYALEENVGNLWEQISGEIQEKCYEDIYKVYERQILAYWECYRDGDLPQLIGYLETEIRNSGGTATYYNRLYNKQHSVAENMFRLSMYVGYSKAVEYFWCKLNEEEKERNIVGSIPTSIKRYDQCGANGKHYKQEKHVEICAFLLGQMEAGHKKELYEAETIGGAMDSFGEQDPGCRYGILRMLLSALPWQEFFIPTLEEMWGVLEEDGHTGVELLSLVATHMKKDHELGYIVENGEYQRILHAVWHKIPEHLKTKIAEDNSALNLICDLLDIWDLTSIKLIINAPEMIQKREKLIESGYTRYVKLIEEDKYELLDQFIAEILNSDEEKKFFKQKIDIWDYFIRGGQYELANKLLDWQCSTEKEKQELKGRMNYAELCQDFIQQDKYELADKVLAWQFDAEDARRSSKDSFKNNKFSSDYIYKLWAVRKEDAEVAKEKSAKFLHWFLNSEEEIAWFKQEKLIKNDQLEKVLCHSFVGYNHFEIIEDFLGWCLLSQEEIQQIKQVVVDKRIWQNCKYDIANGLVDSAETFVKWAFDEEAKRKDFVRQFMTSDDGTRSCHALIAQASDTRPMYGNAGNDQARPTLEEKLNIFTKFINFWIKPLENFHEVKNQLESYTHWYYGEEQTNDLQIFISLLYNIELNNAMMEVTCTGESSNMNM